jgi:hypothetical protein
MNDFTKEDLIEIYEYCNWNKYDTSHSDFRRNLRNKIKSMIDNYCDHKNNVWPLYTISGDLPCAGFCYECGHAVSRGLVSG